MRITLDLDDMKEQKIKGKAVLLKIAYPCSPTRYRVSSKGKGGHVELLNAPVSEELMYNIRFLFGDHDKRIAIDYSRGRNGNPMLPQQVLFDLKIVDGEIKRAGDWIYVSNKSST